MKRIAVYCGASRGKNPIYETHAIMLAKWIASHRYGLVYGGGKIGLMGIVADTVLNNGGSVTGIIPQFLVDREIAHPRLDQLIVTEDMDVRKKKMMELSDCCIALPGGPGTLEEISEAVSWVRVGENDSPCIFYNVNGYYDLVAQFFDQMVSEGFLTQEDRAKVFFIDALDEIEKVISSYQPPVVRKYAK
ncbi:TIGR00730 family Rossman fold protein [Sporolactobacillus terrae]|uniref:Cytokinin riboside 5'-monophosphate phosphoribohydrolase n=1 Tax=Sporolactobacillus terrae TaxID=269673 RepID=A0ABX5Q910_9BACL|nr:TIGR00730 family Rossman fold protein [Sporolactobacillus terrae]QAA23124.1 TIGR00730 family Rossman fold protein [Sporolactobacillus terrae]QAA26094.1 TIGR00730 family Rossman fold protein [Sporolactobacillus terrae]UAK15187.1 TIGR00730 family Rossman fold protein [Sporolactobacillus terrae]